MRILAIIPARGGSKGVPRKNLKHLKGIPLIDHTINALKNVSEITKIVVSTDDFEISCHVQKLGIEVIMRPSELAQDNSLVQDAVDHTIKELEKVGEIFDTIFLFEPTSPIKRQIDIIEAINILKSDEVDSVASFTEFKTPPSRAWRIVDCDTIKPFIEGSTPFLPRQSLEKGYYLNGVLYGAKRSSLEKFAAKSFLVGKIKSIIIPEEFVIDIDSPNDFLLAEFLMSINE